MGVGKVLNEVKPYLYMVLLQVGFSGMYIVSVASLRLGMSHFVLVVYRNFVATVVMTPFALIFERGVRPKMTPLIFLKIMGLVVLEPVLDQNMYYLGAKLTSASFASALVNILPAVTFLMALVLRMEKVRIRSLHSQAKILGTVCTVVGAVLMVLYHGPVVPFPWTRGHHHAAAAAANQSSASWLNGIAMVIGSCVSWAAFFILQVEHAAELPGGDVADGADLRAGHADERRGGGRGGAPRHEGLGHRLRHTPLHRRLLRDRVLRRGLLRAGDRDAGARAGVRDGVPAALHDHHHVPGLHHTQRRDHPGKLDWRGHHSGGALLPHLGQEQGPPRQRQRRRQGRRRRAAHDLGSRCQRQARARRPCRRRRRDAGCDDDEVHLLRRADMIEPASITN